MADHSLMPDPGQAQRQAAVAAELRRLREAAEGPLREREAGEILPAPRETPRPVAATPLPSVAAPAPPAHRPDNTAVNQLWELRHPAPGGWRGALFRIARRLLAPVVNAQSAFNSRQVQLDNELLDYIDTRFAQTHAYYDSVLGHYGRRLADADERHLLLQKELVAHVHDLVKRIDLVLHESERGRLSLEATLRDLRARLARLEEHLARPADR
jgi:hypothetical protein